MVYPHAFQILVWAINVIFMQKLCAIKPGVDALMRPGLGGIIKLDVESQRLCLMRPSGRSW